MFNRERIDFSKVFKKYEEEKSKEKNLEEKKENSFQNVSFSSVVNSQRKDIFQISEIYQDLFKTVKEIYSKEIFEENLPQKVRLILEKLINCFIKNETSSLIKLVFLDYPDKEDFLFYHITNTCIFSLFIGVNLNYNLAQLTELAFATFFHDLGLVKYFNLISLPRTLNLNEKEELKKHPLIGLEILKKLEGLNENVKNAIVQEHERLNGTGYPYGLKENYINEYARIIGLVDVYEALLHYRPYRERHNPLEAIKNILKEKDAFDCRLIKIIMEKIGIFPVGVPVKLNTREIAQVVKENPNNPLRPVVEIIFDSEGKKLEKPRRVDLAINPGIYIENCLKEWTCDASFFENF